MSIKEQIRKKLYTINEYGFEHQIPGAKLDDDEIQWLVDNHQITTEYKPGIKVHSMCTACQARQVFKYEGHKDKQDKTISDFRVKCSFAAGQLPPGSSEILKRYQAKTGVSQEKALLYLKSTIDPSAWAELMFGFRDNEPNWHLRTYQKEQQRCSSLRYAIREGRRAGKSFSVALKLIHDLYNLTIDKGVDLEGNRITAGPEIIVITPYQSQINGIFDDIEMLLKRNKALSSEVETGTGGGLYVKTPFYKIKLADIKDSKGNVIKAGGVISGFVSGVGTKDDGSGGGTIRGTNADVIYLDEMDMIPGETLNKVIKPLLLTRPGVRFYVSSTPIGKRDKFYEYCLQSPDWKEDYLPSSILAQWENLKDELERDNTVDGFAAEYMAHFIEGGNGVFRPALVHASRADYVYADCNLGSNWWKECAKVRDRTQLIKVLGIDWNKNAGSEFVVIAYDPGRHHWFVVDAVNVSASEHSSVGWKQEVLRLNYKWKLDYIYADEGYGHHIIEDLLLEAHALSTKPVKTAFEMETAQLKDRLKAFNFSQKVELRSPIDGTLIKKTGKEFLVENAIRVFEEERLWFPENDNSLVKQLTNYRILRRSPTTNKPVYGPENHSIGDHRLDAFMLALAGIFLEASIYSANTQVASKPKIISREQLKDRAAPQQQMIGAADLIRAGNQYNMHLNVLEISREDPIQESRTSHQSRGRNAYREDPGDKRLKEWMNAAKSSAGYPTDEEYKHQVREGSRPGIARRRRRGYNGRGKNRGR